MIVLFKNKEILFFKKNNDLIIKRQVIQMSLNCKLDFDIFYQRKYSRKMLELNYLESLNFQDKSFLT